MTRREIKCYAISVAIAIAITLCLYLLLEYLEAPLIWKMSSWWVGMIACIIYQKIDQRKEAVEKRAALQTESPS